MTQLFRRVVFNVLVGNRDDHLRNHGFIREPNGWRLSPAYDMNPNASKVEHTLTLDGATAAPNIDAVVQTSELYRLRKSDAAQIVAKTRAAVATWEAEARRVGLSQPDIKRMQSAFAI